MTKRTANKPLRIGAGEDVAAVAYDNARREVFELEAILKAIAVLDAAKVPCDVRLAVDEDGIIYG